MASSCATVAAGEHGLYRRCDLASGHAGRHKFGPVQRRKSGESKSKPACPYEKRGRECAYGEADTHPEKIAPGYDGARQRDVAEQRADEHFAAFKHEGDR